MADARPQIVVPRRSPLGGGPPPVSLAPGEIWADITPGAPALYMGDANGTPVLMIAGAAPTPFVQGYGAMRIAAPVAGADIVAAWQDVTQFDTQLITPENMVTDTATGEFTFNAAGLWQVSTNIVISHNNLGTAREMTFRFVDTATLTPISVFPVDTGQAARVTNFAITGLYPVSAAAVGQPFKLQVQAAIGTYSTVSWEFLAMSFNREADL